MTCHLPCTLVVLLLKPTNVLQLYIVPLYVVIMRAYFTHVRPLVEHDYVIWSP